MTYSDVLQTIKDRPKQWLVTGSAGFIGSNLVIELLKNDQYVRGIDNFATGFKHNIEQIKASVSKEQLSRFSFVEMDIRDKLAINGVVKNVDYVLHQAALGSVPRSLKDPIETSDVNITGFLNVLNAAGGAGVERFVYAASSSTYGDSEVLPKKEKVIGRPLSPYAVTKYVDELFADVFFDHFQLSSVGLRYFNVYGRHQTPNGPYAAVIPKWIGAMLDGTQVQINGDGSTSRDFCYIQNVVQANILAACCSVTGSQIFNVAHGESTTLITLFNMLKSKLETRGFSYSYDPIYKPFRAGDVLHSLADITEIKERLGYTPDKNFETGLDEALDWYILDYVKRKN